MKRNLKTWISAALVLAMLSTVCAFSAAADFNAAVFTSSSDYTVTAQDSGAMEIALNKAAISGYTDASITLDNNDTGLPTLDFDVLCGTDGVYVFRMVFTYTGNSVPSTQKLIFTTQKHNYSFTPAVTYSQAADGRTVETMVVNLASSADLQLVQELASDTVPAQFNVQGAARVLSGSVTFNAKDALNTLYNNYVLAGGLQQNLTSYEKATPCDIIEIVSAPSGVTTNAYTSAVTVNNGAVTITKNPTSETVTEGGNALFIATASNFNYMNWRLVNPTTGEVIYMNAAPYQFTGLSVIGDGTQQLTLSNIPYTLNGWMVEAVFTGNSGSVTSQRATITVNKAATSYLYANPSSGYFQYVYTNVVLSSSNGDRIAYTMYRDGTAVGSGTINSGETVWIEGVSNEYHTVSLYAYTVNDPTNAISCSYTVDCINYNTYGGVYYNGSSSGSSSSSGSTTGNSNSGTVYYYYNPYTGSYTTQDTTSQLIDEWIASENIPDNTEIYNYGYPYSYYDYSYSTYDDPYSYYNYYSSGASSSFTYDEYVGLVGEAYYADNVLPYMDGSTYGSVSYEDNNGITIYEGVDFSGMAGLSSSEIADLIDEWEASESIPD